MSQKSLQGLIAEAQKLTLDEQLELIRQVEKLVCQHSPQEIHHCLWKETLRHRPEILALAAKRGASNVRVFDISLKTLPLAEIHFLVNLEKGRSLLDLGGLTTDLQKLLSCNVYVTSESGLKGEDKERVLAEAILL